MLLARPPRMCCGGENKHRWSIVMVNDVEVYVHSEQWDVVVSFERVEQLLMEHGTTGGG